jgi:hypothetical protein
MAAVSKAALDAGRFANTKAICVPKVPLKWQSLPALLAMYEILKQNEKLESSRSN